MVAKSYGRSYSAQTMRQRSYITREGVSLLGISDAAEIEIPDTLISNYGKELKFSQEMAGTAEIITDDIRLLERFFNPIKSIWKKSIE